LATKSVASRDDAITAWNDIAGRWTGPMPGRGWAMIDIQRWHVARGGLDVGDCLDEKGDWVRYADVADAWAAKVAEIRAAVEAEREASEAAADTGASSADARYLDQARAALDALLAVAP
jgi:hypothetical protein